MLLEDLSLTVYSCAGRGGGFTLVALILLPASVAIWTTGVILPIGNCNIVTHWKDGEHDLLLCVFKSEAPKKCSFEAGVVQHRAGVE